MGPMYVVHRRTDSVNPNILHTEIVAGPFDDIDEAHNVRDNFEDTDSEWYDCWDEGVLIARGYLPEVCEFCHKSHDVESDCIP